MMNEERLNPLEQELEDLENDSMSGQTTSEDYNAIIKPNSVKYSYTQYSISTLLEWIDEGLIVVPSYQRRFVWKKEQSMLLVDSILRGLPIPPIVLFENPKTKRLELLDGLQRMLSVYYYKNNKFPEDPEIYLPKELKDPSSYEDFKLDAKFLETREIDKASADNEEDKKADWKDKLFSELSAVMFDDVRSYARLFNSYIVGILQIQSLDPSYETSLELFSRLNKGGTQLEINEIRMRSASEETLSLVKQITQSTEWGLIKAYVLSKKDTSRELVLRLAVMLEHYSTQENIKPTHTMLDMLMKQDFNKLEGSNSPVAAILIKYKDCIISALQKIKEYTTNNPNEGNPFTFGESKRLNSALAETIITPIAYGILHNRKIDSEKIRLLIQHLKQEEIAHLDNINRKERFREIMGTDSSKVRAILVRHSIASIFLFGESYLNQSQLANKI